MVFLLVLVCSDTVQVLVFLLVPMCSDTAKTVMSLLVSVCCDTARAFVSLLVSVIVTLPKPWCPCWCQCIVTQPESLCPCWCPRVNVTQPRPRCTEDRINPVSVLGCHSGDKCAQESLHRHELNQLGPSNELCIGFHFPKDAVDSLPDRYWTCPKSF